MLLLPQRPGDRHYLGPVKRLAAVSSAVLILISGCTGDDDRIDPAAVSQQESDRLDAWWLITIPGPTDRTLDLLVREQDCASGQSAAGLIASDVRYQEDAVVVFVNVRERTEDRSCPGNPDTPHTVTLREPLGDREVLDGNREPPTRARTTPPFS